MKEPRRGSLRITARGVGGNSIEITIPKTVADLLRITPGQEIDADLFEKGYGKFLGIWNYDQQMKEYREAKT